MTTNKLGRAAAVAAALLFIAALTLFPAAGEAPPPSACVICGLRGVADGILNICLFVPLGGALAYAGLRLARAVPIGCVLSIGIEVVQLFIPGRQSSVGDVVTNTLGTAAGVAAWQLLPVLRAFVRRRSALLALLVPPATFAALALGAALLRPALPAGAWNAVWKGEPGHPIWLEATVTQARLGPLPLRRQWLRDGDAVRGLWLGGAPLVVAAVATGDTVAGASLFGLYDTGEHELLNVGVDGPDAVLRFRTLAAVVRLDQPELRLPGAAAAIRGWGGDAAPRGILATLAAARVRPSEGTLLQKVLGDVPGAGPAPRAPGPRPARSALRRPGLPTVGAPRTTVVRAWKDGRGYCFTVAGRGACGLGWGVARSWAVLLYPRGLGAPAEGAVDALWLFALFLPSGLLLRRRSILLNLASLLGALAWAPWAAGLLPTAPGGWLGALAGLAAGYALRRAGTGRAQAVAGGGAPVEGAAPAGAGDLPPWPPQSWRCRNTARRRRREAG